MPFLSIGVAMLIMSVRFLFRSRFAWIISIVVTTCLVRSVAIHLYSRHAGFVYDDGFCCSRYYSLTAGSSGAALPLERYRNRKRIAAVDLCGIRKPLPVFTPIKDLAMAFYFSVVTIEGRLRMGNASREPAETVWFEVKLVVDLNRNSMWGQNRFGADSPRSSTPGVRPTTSVGCAGRQAHHQQIGDIETSLL